MTLSERFKHLVNKHCLTFVCVCGVAVGLSGATSITSLMQLPFFILWFVGALIAILLDDEDKQDLAIKFFVSFYLIALILDSAFYAYRQTNLGLAIDGHDLVLGCHTLLVVLTIFLLIPTAILTFAIISSRLLRLIKSHTKVWEYAFIILFPTVFWFYVINACSKTMCYP